jgi:hypothetical protein
VDVGQETVPFGRRDAVVMERPSRHAGLSLTVVAFTRGEPRLRAYLHTPKWERIVVVATASSPDAAAARADDLLAGAVARGVAVKIPDPDLSAPRHRDAA